jgi:uncharacterized membrane protein
MLKTEKMLSAVLWLIMAGFAVWAHFNLIDVPMAVHFDSHGSANGYESRDIGVSIIPAVSAVAMVLLLWILPSIMPKAHSIQRSEGAYGAVTLTIFAFLTMTQAMLVLSQAGVAMDVIRIIFTGVGLLFVVLGNYLPKTRKNWLMGIRTPWTLSDERVWDKTHRFAGPVFMLGGAVTILSTWFAPVDWRLPVMVIAILTASFGSYIYSYFVARALKNV